MANQPNIPYDMAKVLPLKILKCYAVTLSNTTPASLLTGGPSIFPKALLIKAAEANAASVFICNSSDTDTTAGFQLPANTDESVLIGVNHNNIPYGIAASNAEKMRVIALG